MIWAPIDLWVCVQSNDDIVTMLTHLKDKNEEYHIYDKNWREEDEDIDANFFKEIKMADVEKVESAGNIDNLLTRLGALTVGKLWRDLNLKSLIVICVISIKSWRYLEKFLCGR